MSGDIVTKEKFQELEKEHHFLTTTKRQEIAETLEYAKSLGDLSENAEYHDARGYQAEVEARIKTLEYLLKNATIVKKTNSGKVEIGSTVTLRKKGDKKTIEYTIVGSEESDMLKGKISFNSPIGSALMDKSVKDEVSIQIPTGTVEYQVISIK